MTSTTARPGKSVQVSRVSCVIYWRLIAIGTLAIALSALGYVLLVNCSVPAVDELGRMVFRSSFRLSRYRYVRPEGGVSILLPEPSLADWLFWPIDAGYRLVCSP